MADFEAAVAGSAGTNRAQGGRHISMLKEPLGPAFFLSGDEYPNHARVELAVRTRLAPLFCAWIGQEDILARAGADFSTDVSKRVTILEQQVLSCDDPSRVVLIGRCSGARVVTLLASRLRVAATISLGYPFRHPKRALEIDRFDHLHRASVPGLIIQGVRDSFGGLNITEDYPLSRSMSVKFVSGGHSMHLPAREWDDVARSIRDFCQAAFVDPKEQFFDEGYYLQVYPDAAADIACGLFLSGKDHYQNVGWRQKRRFRLSPNIWDEPEGQRQP